MMTYFTNWIKSKKCEFRVQYNDCRDDRMGRPHHQEHGRAHPRGGGEDVRQQEAVRSLFGPLELSFKT